MKYIAIFDIPDDYIIGCANAKIAPKGKEVYYDDEFEDAYAHVEPLAEEKAEVFEQFEMVDGVISDLGLHCGYDMPGFWTDNRKHYVVIPTKFHKGYMKALEDVERTVRQRFGFSEREFVHILPKPFRMTESEDE